MLRPRRAKLSYTAVIDIDKILAAVTYINDTGQLRYIDGWSDEIIAAKVGVGVNTVKRIRWERYGNIPHGRVKGKKYPRRKEKE